MQAVHQAAAVFPQCFNRILNQIIRMTASLPAMSVLYPLDFHFANGYNLYRDINYWNITGGNMELRTMRYFLAVAREENMTRAAQLLHVTQPALSKQLKALEDELGKKLFTRHSFSIQLTEEGVLLRKRAEDLIKMADKITTEFLALDDVLGGDVYFGLAESYQIRCLAATIRRFKESYPDLHYHITSGDTEQVTEKLDKGIIDFAVLAQEPNTTKYHYLTFPHANLWGVVMPENCPLVEKDSICVDDLFGLPLFCSEQG